MDKKKIVFAAVIGVVVLFIIGYSVLVLGGDDEAASELQQTLVPDLEEGEDMYSSKKVAVDAIKEYKATITKESLIATTFLKLNLPTYFLYFTAINFHSTYLDIMFH